MRGLVRHVAGWSLLVLGLAGLVLPVLQGWLFIAIGALLLAPDVPLFAKLVCWIEARFPAIRRGVGRLRRWLHRNGESPPPCPPE